MPSLVARPRHVPQQGDSRLEVGRGALSQSADVRRTRLERSHLRIELVASLCSRDGVRNQFVVTDGQRDANEFGIVGDVVREERKDRQSLRVPESA